MDIQVPLDPDPGRSRGFDPAISHFGIDYNAVLGSPILASAAGVVSRVADEPTGFGNLVAINHDEGFSTLYAHLSRIDVVPDQPVAARQLIGLTGGVKGAPGAGNSNGPHLHYEVRINNNPVNPDGQFSPFQPTSVFKEDDVLYRAITAASDRSGTAITAGSVWANAGTRFLRVDVPPAGAVILEVSGDSIAEVRAEQLDILAAARRHPGAGTTMIMDSDFDDVGDRTVRVLDQRAPDRLV